MPIRQIFVATLIGLSTAVSTAAYADKPSKFDQIKTDLSDTGITAKVKTDLATKKIRSLTDIQVETNNGVITLGGNVNSMDEKSAAEKVAYLACDEKCQVINAIKIRPKLPARAE